MPNYNLNYGSQYIDNEDINEVKKVLKSPFLTKGPKIEEFEKVFSKKVKSKFAISCTSGTAALHLVYRSLEITKGDIVVSPTLTFSGTVSPAKILGADIIFADCDKNTGLININSVLEIIQKLIKINRIKNLKVISVVNLNGQTPNLKLLSQLSKKYKFYIIEDACHSLGSFYENKKKFPVGSCKYSDFSTFSFHPVKAITTGEGGMITTNNKRYYNYIKKLRNHNFDYPKKAIKNKPWFYAINDIFLNYRMSDINAALGLSQLKKLDKFVEKRNLLASYYSELLRKYKCKNIEIVKNLDYSTHSYHLFVILINFRKLKINKKQLINRLRNIGIFTQVHYVPLHTQQYYKKTSLIRMRCKNAEAYYESALSLPIYYQLKKNDINIIVKNLIKFIS